MVGILKPTQPTQSSPPSLPTSWSSIHHFRRLGRGAADLGDVALRADRRRLVSLGAGLPTVCGHRRRLHRAGRGRATDPGHGRRRDPPRRRATRSPQGDDGGRDPGRSAADHLGRLERGDGSGAEIMSRIAAPMLGGMLSAPLLSLLVVPAVVALWWRGRRRGRG